VEVQVSIMRQTMSESSISVATGNHARYAMELVIKESKSLFYLKH
jgi:hypothetical protein